MALLVEALIEAATVALNPRSSKHLFDGVYV